MPQQTAQAVGTGAAAADPGERLQPHSLGRMEPVTDCHAWTGPKNRKGYGLVGKRGLAHRAAWEGAHGPIPAGLLVCHHCDNPPCVRVSHLFLGTHADNMRDAALKGRIKGGALRGEANRAKLTTGDVVRIRQMASTGYGYRRLSRLFSVGHSVMKRVLNGQDWAHVPLGTP